MPQNRLVCARMQNEWRDYDFFIVIQDGVLRSMEPVYKIYMALAEFPMKVLADVIVSCENDF